MHSSTDTFSLPSVRVCSGQAVQLSMSADLYVFTGHGEQFSPTTNWPAGQIPEICTNKTRDILLRNYNLVLLNPGVAW